MQEKSELLKKSEVFINNFTEDVHESAADKFRNNEDFTSQMFKNKNKNESKICKIQIIFYEINKQICESKEVNYKIKYTLQKNKDFFCKKVDTFMKTLKFRKFSENFIIHKLKLKIQLTEQKHLNL